MGLPGSGKTTLASELVPLLKAKWLNADEVRKEANDWDFSAEGRKRQANRMKAFADFEASNGRSVICDFVAPTENARLLFKPDYLIWLDTIKEGRVVDNKKKKLKNSKDLPFEVETLENSQAFKDTTNMFEEPKNANKIINSFMSDQEIAAEPQVADGLDLIIQALPESLIALNPLLAITLFQAHKALLPDVVITTHSPRSFKIRILFRAGGIQAEGHITAFRNLKGVVAGLREVLENFPHLLCSLEVNLCRVAHPFLIKNKFARSDTDHHVVGLVIIPG